MKKKQLLFINGHLNTGGVEKALVDMLTHLDYDRYEVDLLLTEGLGDYESLIPPNVHIILRSIEGTYGSFWPVLKRALRNQDCFSIKMKVILLCMRFFGISKISLAKKMLTGGKSYDCVIGYRRGFCTQIAAFAVNAKKRITWWHHGTFNVESESYLKEVTNCDHIVAVSNACRNMLLEQLSMLDNRIVTIHNMIDVDRVKERALLFDPNFQDSKFHIVSVGGLVPEKHFDNAIHAARKLKELGIAFQWHLVGDGVEREKLHELAKRLQVEDVFIFEGNQPNPYPYMAHADLFVHPSYVESFGIVVAEALALGLPCVVTRSSGVMDFLVDGENAIITERDADDLAEKIIQLIENEQLLKNLSAHSKLPEEFLPEAVIKKIDKIVINDSQLE